MIQRGNTKIFTHPNIHIDKFSFVYFIFGIFNSKTDWTQRQILFSVNILCLMINMNKVDCIV